MNPARHAAEVGLNAGGSIWVRRAKGAVLHAFPLLRRVLPSRYRPYRFAGGKIFLDVTESPMMLARALGIYELEKTLGLQELLRLGATFVDVGGNKGDFSLLAARRVGPTGRVLAFEPEPSNCEWIRRSVELSGYTCVSLQQIALGDAAGEITLHLSGISGHHSVVGGRSDASGNAIQVKQRTLDAVLEETGDRRVDAIKIDVEGADLSVLRGARRALTENPGVVVFMDVHPHLGVDALEVCRFFRELGFSLFEMRRPFTTSLEPSAGLLELVARR